MQKTNCAPRDSTASVRFIVLWESKESYWTCCSGRLVATLWLVSNWFVKLATKYEAHRLANNRWKDSRDATDIAEADGNILIAFASLV